MKRLKLRLEILILLLGDVLPQQLCHRSERRGKTVLEPPRRGDPQNGIGPLGDSLVKLIEIFRRGILNLCDRRPEIHGTFAGAQKQSLSRRRIVETIQTMVREVPSAFNMQSGKVVVALGAVHDRIWDITMDTLRAIVPPANFAVTEQKIHSFAAAYGTVLFFDDTSIVDDLARQFPAYADNFPVWAQLANGMMQFAVWTALADLGLGVNIQHYNPLIDDEVKQLVHAPESWKLIAQMPFGQVLEAPKPIQKVPVEERVKIVP